MTHQNILQIYASGRSQESLSRAAADQLVTALRNADPSVSLTQRDLRTGLPFVDEAWIGANFTDPEHRTEAQRQALALSDSLVRELQGADYLVIASPLYNFGIPAVLKAWVDLVARARLTFKYTEQGAVGLLQNKRAYLVMASGGVPIGSEMDLATRYLKQVLGFLGITDIHLLDATTDVDAQVRSLVTDQEALTA